MVIILKAPKGKAIVLPNAFVVGQPMEVPKLENPTSEEIEEYHAKFVEHLQRMFEEQKYNYLQNAADTKLVIE